MASGEELLKKTSGPYRVVQVVLQMPEGHCFDS
jgi:hypothetical protein